MLSWRALLSCCTLTVTGAGLAAEPKLDLERTAPVAADQPIPIQDFFRPPLWRQPKLNPSGTDLAALVGTNDDRFQLMVYNLKAKSAQNLAAGDDQDVQDFSWLNDHRLIFRVSSEKLYDFGIFAVDLGPVLEPYPLLQYTGAVLVSIPAQNRLFPLIWLRQEFSRDGRHDRGVKVVNSGIRSGKIINPRSSGDLNSAMMDAQENNLRHVADGFPLPPTGIAYRYLADRSGRLAFAFTSEAGALALYRLTAERVWQKSPLDPETAEIVAAGDKPDEVVALVPGGPGKPGVLRYVNAVTGEPSDVIVGDKQYDFDGWVFRNPASRQIVGAMYERDGPRTLWFDEGYRGVQAAVDALFPGQVVRVIGQSEKGALFLIATFSDRHPVAYHWVDLEHRTAGLIVNTMPWIDPARMQSMHIMKYTTTDGRQLDAYVTLPTGASKKRPVPLVVLPHGGPWVRDTWRFNGEVQFLASRGYAVLQPNYRGSPGYDWMFPMGDQWEFRKMHDDVTAATHKLLETGVIDPNRVAIMGGSFGAYLALSGVAYEPTLYRCAVTIAGVFDWATVLQARKYDQYSDPAYARLLRKLGDPTQQAQKFADLSPLRHVAQVRVPVFVAHGTEDPIASIAESRRLLTELEKFHVPHEKLFVSGEGHGMKHVKNQVELYTEIEAFLARNLTPLAAPEAAAAPAPTGR